MLRTEEMPTWTNFPYRVECHRHVIDGHRLQDTRDHVQKIGIERQLFEGRD